MFTGGEERLPVGASALGEVALPDKVKAGEFHHNMGLYEDTAAAAKTSGDAHHPPRREHHSHGRLPLSKATVKPDVVIVVASRNRCSGSYRRHRPSRRGAGCSGHGGGSASCVDSTVIPLMTDRVNISLGCFGCRETSDILPEEMLVGIPWTHFEETVAAIEKMAQGAITEVQAEDLKTPSSHSFLPNPYILTL